MRQCLFAVLAAVTLGSSVCAGEPVDLAAFIALSRPVPTVEIRYGEALPQAIDVFLPARPGPHPVAVLIHGGCWRNIPAAGREQLRHLGPELNRSGIAVWSIGYRRADEAGGGYPGTFQDVDRALDRLRAEAERYNLDLSRTVLVGHSAGGHLALWASARRHLPVSSPLYNPHPFVPGRVISLAGVGDLESFAKFIPVVCGPGIVESLTNVPGADLPSAYADVSPAAMPAPDASIQLISGVLDRLVPPYAAYDYARRMKGKNVTEPEMVNLTDAGHFDLVAPGSDAWKEVRSRIEAALTATP